MFATSEMELDYYHQKLNLRFASLVLKPVKTGIIGNEEILGKSQNLAHS